MPSVGFGPKIEIRQTYASDHKTTRYGNSKRLHHELQSSAPFTATPLIHCGQDLKLSSHISSFAEIPSLQKRSLLDTRQRS